MAQGLKYASCFQQILKIYLYELDFQGRELLTQSHKHQLGHSMSELSCVKDLEGILSPY